MNLTQYNHKKGTIHVPSDTLWTPDLPEVVSHPKRLEYLKISPTPYSKAFYCILSTWEGITRWSNRGEAYRFQLPNDTPCAVGIGGGHHLLTTLSSVEDKVFELPHELLELNWGFLEVVIPVTYT